MEVLEEKTLSTTDGKVSLPEKFVYFFAAGETEGRADMDNVLGGKGANLAEMTSLGLPVPPGFTISTDICQCFYKGGEKLPEPVLVECEKAMARMEKILGKKFGDNSNPLLVSVRSGAPVSMPGMMDTILNLGLNDEAVEGLAKSSANPRFAWDSYRRFLQMYSNVVMGMNSSYLDVTMEDLKDSKGYINDTEMTTDDLKVLAEKFKKQIFETTSKNFPMDPKEQMWGAISAVFRSWNTLRAKVYREIHSLPDSWGTAVNVQAMVFGNMGNDSATGVAFTRNPSTGEKRFFGEFLINAQGEDVVAGIRTPHPITEEEASQTGQVLVGQMSLEKAMPDLYKELAEVFHKLETHYRDMQDIEFTVERGKLWMLQTRAGKRTARAALKIACDMMDERLIDGREALLRLEPGSLEQLLHPTLDPKDKKTLLTKGLPASPGGAVGKIVFSSEEAVKASAAGEKVILVRVETSPEDIQGMISAQGILTSRGGMTSHAAVVARGMGKCCVAGAGEVDVDDHKKQVRVQGHVLAEGDVITLDGSTGEVFHGEVNMLSATLDGNFERFMKLADKSRRLGVRANADTPHDAQTARRFGAEGIGLCRTEHMFFGADRIDIVREMIMADSHQERVTALEKLLPMQRQDFNGIFEAMEGLPVTIRLLDPPLHEFLPHSPQEVVELAGRLGWEEERLRSKVNNLSEMNPMLGHRGCRLAISYPEIYQMQARAIALAGVDTLKKGKKVLPEIMIPLIATEKELSTLRQQVEKEVVRVQEETGEEFAYLVGTMIELPRAAVTADEIAHSADFFSFGTNDLTQTTLGLSRDDSGKFLATYVSKGLLPADPFASLDVGGVGKLVQKGVELGRQTRPDIKLGICGEHGGDPASIEFFHSVGLHYVSCSPYRVPIARLAAAQAALRQGKVKH